VSALALTTGPGRRYAASGPVGRKMFEEFVKKMEKVKDQEGPRHGIALLTGHGWRGIAVLGGVFLAMTGGEAMYRQSRALLLRLDRMGWLFLL
jgi:hypothetical protein